MSKVCNCVECVKDKTLLQEHAKIIKELKKAREKREKENDKRKKDEESNG